MELKVYIDGNLHPKSEAKVSVFDHGLLYGDGVFEGIRCYNGLVFRLNEHLDRLYESAHTIMLAIPLSKKEMTQAVLQTLKANQLKNAYIRLVVTRGVGDLGLDPRKCKKATVIIITDNIVLYPETLYRNGLEIITVPTVRNLPEALNPQIKSLNYLNNIMAKIEATSAGYQEAIMLNFQGYVTECTGDNIFLIKEGVLITPPAYLGALKGITRDAIMELALKQGVRCEEKVITRHEVFNAEEVFLTGTAAEIIPVVKVDGRKIGQGKPGRLTLQLMKAFHKLTKEDGVRYSL
ncbi:MAG TPA: branched-chain-amino-acid transaminase [Candidatus Omnitrophota bacterium]|nr:branched-chain-amino-acid transaminase [Candidatus Omnitrophota bacterium]